MNDECDTDYKLGKFYQNVNKLIANFNGIQSNVIASLFNSYCCSYYGSSIWRLSSSQVHRVIIAWNKAVRRLWRVHYQTHTSLLPVLMNCIPLLDQLYNRFIKMFKTMRESSNVKVQYLARKAVSNARGIIGFNFASFCNRYKVGYSNGSFSLNNLYDRSRYEVYSNVSNVCTAHTVKELCEVRDGFNILEHFNTDFIETIIESLCIS